MSGRTVEAVNGSFWVYRDGGLQKTPSLLEALGFRNKKQVIVSAVGGGGKTTTLHRLADEYVSAGRQVIAATTTHIQREEDPWFLEDPSADEVKETLGRYGQAWVGTPVRGGRLAQMEDELFKQILEWEIPVLIEADGARRRPMKIPAGHEPVIVPQTTHVLGIYGIETVGRPMEEVCFRLELAEKFLGKSRTELVTGEDIARLAASEQGGRKGCPYQAEYTVILNKADNEGQRETALEICRMLEKSGIRRMIVTGRS